MGEPAGIEDRLTEPVRDAMSTHARIPSRHNSCLIVFARCPRRGTVKTRLQTAHSAARVLQWYVAFLRDTLEMACTVRGVRRRVIAFTPHNGEALLRRTVGMTAAGFDFVSQQGADLGERLRHSFLESFRHGAKLTVIIGTDSPSLPARLVEEAFTALTRNDLVLGPSTDGGFYLIGARSQPIRQAQGGESGVRSRNAGTHDKADASLERLFAGVAWSTDRVLKQTVARARRVGMKMRLLAPWYDVDDAVSLRFLKTHLELLAADGSEGMARHSRRALRNL